MKDKLIIVGIIVGVFLIIVISFSILQNKNSGKKTSDDLENTVSLGRSYKIHLDEKIVIKDEGLHIQLVNVNDSRCPKNVECYWEGEIEYQFIINDNSYTLSAVNNREVSYGMYLISLDKDNNSLDYAKIIVKKMEGEFE